MESLIPDSPGSPVLFCIELFVIDHLVITAGGPGTIATCRGLDIF